MNRDIWSYVLRSVTGLILMSPGMMTGAYAATPIAGVLAQALRPDIHQAQSAKAVGATLNMFFLGTSGNGAGPSIAVDGRGGIHVAASAYGPAADDSYPVYYAYCASSCASPTNWAVINLEDTGIYGGNVRLALDSSGHPRMMWTRAAVFSGAGEYRYAVCDTRCTRIANWTVTSVAHLNFADHSRYFALDPQGRPRFVYADNDQGVGHIGTFYRYCDAACTNPANFRETMLAPSLLSNISLAFTSRGQLRFAFEYAAETGNALGYFECSASCNIRSNWAFLLLADTGPGHSFTLQLDKNDRPRLAYYTGNLGDSLRSLQSPLTGVEKAHSGD